MKRICVFAGSSEGRNSAYRAAADALGRMLAERGLGLVFGGGRFGLMGVAADAALAAGGEVIGIIPRGLMETELPHKGVTELRVVDTMNTRKALMAELSDGFISLPGGLGTFEETLEIITWAQLGLHQKPIGLLDVEGYYAPLLAFLSRACEEGFIRPDNMRLFVAEKDPAALLSRLDAYQPPPALEAGLREEDI